MIDTLTQPLPVHTEFLLQRALINRKHTDTKELIPISKRLLSLVLLSQSKRDLFRDFQGDLTYLVSRNRIIDHYAEQD